jgi:hypothetical protein
MANDQNMLATVVIDVLFSFNLAATVSVSATKCMLHHSFFYFFMFAAPLQFTLAVWYRACSSMTNGGTGTEPPMY